MQSLPSILLEIRQTKEREVADLLQRTSLSVLRQSADRRLAEDPPRPFEEVFQRPSPLPHIIAEIKKASPSKGVIRPGFDPVSIAKAYTNAGASAISCLTDTLYFQGSLEFLPLIRKATPLPILRKDFLIHPAQIWESCAAGADAILLIARMLEEETLNTLYRLARELSLGVLIEVHDQEDLEKALRLSPTLLGINNRDLHTFEVDFEITFRLLPSIPSSIRVVSESGIFTHNDLLRLAKHGVAAALIGESLMRADDPEVALRGILSSSASEGGF